MPRAKRLLEETDANAQQSTSKSSKGNDNERRRSLRSSGPAPDIEVTDLRVVKYDPKAAKETLNATGKVGKSGTTSRKSNKGKGTAYTSTKASASTRRNDKASKSDDVPDESDELEHPNDTISTDDDQRPAQRTEPSSSQAKKKSNNKSQSESEDEWDKVPRDKQPSYVYIVGQPPPWDWDDQNVGKPQKQANDAYDKMMAKLKPNLNRPLDRLPKHKWPIMNGASIRYVDAIYDSNKRDPDLLDMYIYNDFQGYGLHEIVENMLVAYHKEFIKKATDRNLNELWSIMTGFIWYAKQHSAMSFLFGHIDDGERVCNILALIGTTFLSLLDLVEQAGQLKPVDSDFKDLALVMKIYIVWAEEWDAETFDHSTQKWAPEVLKYARNHDVDLSAGPPTMAGKAVADIEKRTVSSKRKQKPWPKPGPDRWGFKKAFNYHAKRFGRGGNNFDITLMSKADRIRYSFDKKDPFADIPAKELREGKIVIGTM